MEKDKRMEKSPENDPLAVIDNMENVAEHLGGLRRILMTQGFGEDDASKIVVAIMQQNAAETWVKVLGIGTDES